MAKKLTTSLTGFKERQCTMAIVLDIRSNRKDVTEYPVKARFTIDRRSYYYPIGGSYSKQEFSEICNVQKSKSPKYEEKKRLLDIVDKYKTMLINLNPGHELTLDVVRMVVEGKVHRSDKARLVRDGIVVHTGAINALKRYKDDVKEVATNFECGISLVNFNDIQVGDIIETFAEIEVQQKL